MSRINITALVSDRKPILEEIQRLGVVEIRDAEESGAFGRKDTGVTRNLLARNLSDAETAVAILDQYKPAPSASMLSGKREVGDADFERVYSQSAQLDKLCGDIKGAADQIASLRTEAERIETQIAALQPWLAVDIPLSFTKTKTSVVSIGCLSGQLNEEDIRDRLREADPDLPPCHIEICTQTNLITVLWTLTAAADAARADKAFAALGFTRPAVTTDVLPKEEHERLTSRMQSIEKQITVQEKKIVKLADRRNDLLLLADQLRMRIEKYGVIERLLHTRHVFVLQGYIPQQSLDSFGKRMHAKFACVTESFPPEDPDDAPVLLKNTWFSRPVESVVAGFGLPKRGEIDPTALVSVFYYVLFGLMFSDAGYGLILGGACAVLLARRSTAGSMRNFLWMFFWCGVSTFFWGAMFGSWFGDGVNAFSTQFFGKSAAIPAIWFEPMSSSEPTNVMKLLVFCLALGVVHLTFGYVMKAVQLVRNRDYLSIVYDAVFPVLLIYCLIAILVTTSLFRSIATFMTQAVTYPAALTNALLAVSAICAVGIVLTAGRESRNWFKRLLKGAYGLYNVLAGWLGDILSYSRLLALGLATGVVATVINSLAGMMPKNIAGHIAFVIIFLLGQAINFAINVLGAYVHCNRLQYVEYFGKFYEGGGRAFSPFGIHTKHVQLSKEEQHG